MLFWSPFEDHIFTHYQLRSQHSAWELEPPKYMKIHLQASLMHKEPQSFEGPWTPKLWGARAPTLWGLGRPNSGDPWRPNIGDPKSCSWYFALSKSVQTQVNMYGQPVRPLWQHATLTPRRSCTNQNGVCMSCSVGSLVWRWLPWSKKANTSFGKTVSYFEGSGWPLAMDRQSRLSASFFPTETH